MPDEKHEAFLTRSLRETQENIRRAGPALAGVYTLIGSILLLGGAGFAADRWLDTAPWLLLTGLMLGLVVGFVELARIIWRK